jgi:hypothetical protein
MLSICSSRKKLTPQQLHPDHPLGYSDASDPLIMFWRSYPKPPYFIAGNIEWLEDAEKVAPIVKPYYRKLSRWIKDNWKRIVPGTPYYYGPEAQNIVEETGAEVRAFEPSTVNIQEVPVRDPGNSK